MSNSAASRKVPAAKVNMRMIAKKAGVSATTVSLALRDDASISSATKLKIRELQKALGYRLPSRRSKAGGEKATELESLTYRIVGIDLREETYAPFLHGVSAECAKRNIKLELEFSLDRDFGLESRSSRGGNSGTERGLILTGLLDDRHIAVAQASGTPFVVLGNYSFSVPVHMAAIDLMGAACAMLQSLADEGMKSLAIVVEQSRTPFERSFLRNLRGAFLDLGFSMDQELLIEAGTGFSKMGDAAEKILRHHKPGMKLLTFEPHCAQHLVIELHTRRSGSAPPLEIATFGDAPPGASPPRHYRIFSAGKEECARLAVIRASELFRDPDIPPCTSVIRSPGWI